MTRMLDGIDLSLMVHARPGGHYVVRVIAGPFKTNAEAWQWIDDPSRRKQFPAQPETEPADPAVMEKYNDE